MSEYFRFLDPAAKVRYAAKLQLLDLTENDDIFRYVERQKLHG
jgi:hypothetical protein